MFRVAAYQSTPKTTLNARKEHMIEALEEAREKKIDFLCLPEGFLTGYYAEKEFALTNSLEVQSSDFQKIVSLTTTFETTLIVGFNEKQGNQIFDSAAVIEKGKLLGVQRKHYLYHPYFTPGNQFLVFQSKGVIFGIVICLDTNYFEPSRLLALQKASLFFVPMCNKISLDHPFSKRPLYYSHFIARAHENRCWLVSADWVYPDDGKMVCLGHSVIYDPDGNEKKRSKEGKEQFVIEDIPIGRLYHEKGRRTKGSPILLQEIEKLRQDLS